jgi:hypothetical protein
MIEWLLGIYVSVLILLASVPVFQAAGAQLDLVKLIAEFIQKLLVW